MNRYLAFIFIISYSYSSTKLYGFFADSGYVDLILVGVDHPYHYKDNIILLRFADSLRTKSPYFKLADRFSTGEDLMDKLVYYTGKYHSIRHLAIVGHSGYEGYFVRNNSGFYRDQYQGVISGGNIKLTPEARRINDLRKNIMTNEIIFHPNAIVVLVGCNTAYSKENIAYELADVINRPVVGANQKIDLYNVENFGEYMLGKEQKTFIAYIPLESEMVCYDLSSSSITISETLRRVQEKITKKQ